MKIHSVLLVSRLDTVIRHQRRAGRQLEIVFDLIINLSDAN
jgi:hypothetical protein